MVVLTDKLTQLLPASSAQIFTKRCVDGIFLGGSACERHHGVEELIIDFNRGAHTDLLIIMAKITDNYATVNVFICGYRVEVKGEATGKGGETTCRCHLHDSGAGVH